VEAGAATHTAAGQSGFSTALSRQGGTTSQFTSGDHQGSEAVNQGLQPADVSLQPNYRDPIEAVPGPNRSSPPTRRGSVGSTQIGSNGSRSVSVGSTHRGSNGSRSGSVGSTQMGDGGDNDEDQGDSDQGGGGQASRTAIRSRGGNGAEGKKV
jgi:hypothetical protein